MIFIIFFFIEKNNEIHIKNNTKIMLEDIYKLKSGNYIFKEGSIYNNNDYIVSDYHNVSGVGKINVDNYGNVEFYIDTNNYCISKTYLGSVEISKKKCKDFKEIEVEFIRNNNTLSFITNLDKSEYMISTKDDFKGIWIENNNSTVVLESYNEGDNYIWFKDSDGNVSDVIEFKVECLITNNTKYNKNVFYCSGSKVIIDDISWIVIKDTYDKITLISNEAIDKKLPHCIKGIDGNCQFIDKEIIYNWDNSYINQYLNYEYIKNLSDDTVNSIVDEEICIDIDVECDNEKCIGLTKKEIEEKGYTCNIYTKSKLRLITYSEYNYLYNNLNKNIIGTNYWIMNTYLENKGSIIDNNDDIFIDEELYLLHYVKPVISLYKLD